MKTIVVDIDGTVADCSWRHHYLETKPKNWTEFWNGIEDDAPILDNIWLVNTLHQAGNQIVMCTGRQEQHRPQTEEWLKKYNVPYVKMYMRETNDYRDDSTVKVELIQQMRADGFDPYVVLEDRDRVVKAFREIGLRVLQVNYGDF